MNATSSGILDVNDIKSVIRVFAKNWWILIVFVLVFFIAGYIHAYKLPDVYAAETQILLQTNDKYYANSVISTNSATFGYQTYINNSNEISVIRSFDLI